jgi:uncharacterized membrane protein
MFWLIFQVMVVVVVVVIIVVVGVFLLDLAGLSTRSAMRGFPAHATDSKKLVYKYYG